VRRLSVLVDATSVPPNRGGVARYVSGLLQGLDELGASVDVVAKPSDLDWLRDLAPAHRYHEAPRWLVRRPLRLLWEQVGLPALALRRGSRRVLSPHYTFPLVLSRRCVVTLHDATFFSDPEAHGRLKRTFFRAWTRAARSAAAGTVAPSAATAAELDRFVGRRAPTHVAHLGVDAATFRVPGHDEVASFSSHHALDPERGWIAFLGTIEPRKRVGELIAAHRSLGQERPVPPLLVAGGPGWDDDAVAQLRDAGDRAGADLRYLGYLPLGELAAFLGGATVVAYPSVGEGFGLPVLEGMACGAPVLTTPRTALAEVGGDAVAYTEPDASSIRRDLGALLDDDERRAALAAAGRARAAEFTWAACARAHLPLVAA